MDVDSVSGRTFIQYLLGRSLLTWATTSTRARDQNVRVCASGFVQTHGYGGSRSWVEWEWWLGLDCLGGEDALGGNVFGGLCLGVSVLGRDEVGVGEVEFALWILIRMLGGGWEAR